MEGEWALYLIGSSADFTYSLLIESYTLLIPTNAISYGYRVIAITCGLRHDAYALAAPDSCLQLFERRVVRAEDAFQAPGRIYLSSPLGLLVRC